jgi:hypothetical protein
MRVRFRLAVLMTASSDSCLRGCPCDGPTSGTLHNFCRWAKDLVDRSSVLFEASHEGAYLFQNAAPVAGPEPVIVAI